MEIFLKEIEAFLQRTDMAPSAFGEKYAGDRNFVFDVRKGRDVGLRKADGIRARMVEHMQDSAA
jgi:hypothetical protein